MKYPILSTLFAAAVFMEETSALRQQARSIAFAGGGFRAHAVASGVMAGLLGAAQDSNVLKEKPTFDTLMRSIDTIASNSGGTWFSTQFIYSANFEKFLEKMAQFSSADLTKIAAVYNNDFISHLSSLGEISDAMLQMPQPEFTSGDLEASLLFNSTEGFNVTMLEEHMLTSGLTDYVLSKVLEFVLREITVEAWAGLLLNYFRAKDVTWRSFVNLILSIPGDINPDLALDTAPVNTWAQNKRFAAAGGLVQPDPRRSRPQRMTAGGFEEFCSSPIGIPDRYSIAMTNRFDSPGLSTPVTFSTYLQNGNDNKTDSPFPFIRIPSKSSKRYNEQTYYGMYDTLIRPWGVWGIDADIKSSYHEKDDLPGPGYKSHRMKILDVASTSSSFLSQKIALYEKLGSYANALHSIGIYKFLTGFITPVALNPSIPAEKMFSEGLSSRHAGVHKKCRDWHNEHIKARVAPLTDGAYIDNSAVSNVLADAQDGDEFTLVLNSDKPINEDIWNLFSGPNSVGDDFTQVPISSKKSQKDVYIEVSQFPSLTIPPGANKVLKAIRYGTIDVETSEQPYFGVKAGINIKLNIIAVQADMALAPVAWADPSRLVGEIVATLKYSKNSPYLQKILNDFFDYCECDCVRYEYDDEPVNASIVTLQRNTQFFKKNAIETPIDYIELTAGDSCKYQWRENFNDGEEHFLTPEHLDACFHSKVVSMRIRYTDICLKTGGSIPVRFVFDSSLANEVHVRFDGDDVYDNLSPMVDVIDRCNVKPTQDKIPVFDAASVDFSHFLNENIRDTQVSRIEFVSSNDCKFVWAVQDQQGATNSIQMADVLKSSCMEPYDILSARFVYSKICPSKSFEIPGKVRIGTDSTNAIAFALKGNKPETGLYSALTIKK